MNANGTGVTRINAAPGLDTQPVWSPDGTRIAFTTARFGGGLDIAVMNSDGTNVRQLTSSLRDEIELGRAHGRVGVVAERRGVDARPPRDFS